MEKPIVDKSLCSGCEVCVEECPNTCLEIVEGVAELVRPEDCDGCGSCAEVCPSEAIHMEEG